VTGLALILKRTKIDTSNLERGMYVAQLDRPWLETPFLFQGFEVREDSELRLLRQFCRHVYIDVSRCSLPRERVLKALQRQDTDSLMQRAGVPPRALTVFGRLMRLVSRFDPTGLMVARLSAQRHYRNQVATGREAPHAIRAYDGAVATMSGVLAQVRAGAGINVDTVRAAAAPLIDSVLRNQDAMAWLVYLRKREEYAGNHSIGSAVWAVILGRHLGFDREGLETLAMGGMLLDIGKARMPESLTDRAGRLRPAEVEAMRKHVKHGVELVRLTPGINADVLAMISGHHERADGSGYPQGLQGADIPVFARIAGLVDCYDAMISHRPWAPAMSPEEALLQINRLSGRQFQKEMVEHFVQALGAFPTGCVVELNTGEVGIVVEQNRIRRLRPKVLVVLDAGRHPLPERSLLNLARRPSDQQRTDARWIVCGHEAGAFGVDPKHHFIA